jgi:hypothetical protein
MRANDIMLSTLESILNTEIKNKGFALLDQLFKEHGWHMVKNDLNWVCYSKFCHETDLFDIKIDSKSIHVSVPIRNSPFQYRSVFKDYFQASEYIEARFLDFIQKS